MKSDKTVIFTPYPCLFSRYFDLSQLGKRIEFIATRAVEWKNLRNYSTFDN